MNNIQQCLQNRCKQTTRRGKAGCLEEEDIGNLSIYSEVRDRDESKPVRSCTPYLKEIVPARI